MNAFRQLLGRVRATGRKRIGKVRTVAMGRERWFRAYDVEGDTFIFELGVANHLGERPSVLVVEKSRLDGQSTGHILTVSTGNHAVAAMPLLDGRFWQISKLSPDKRGETLFHGIICANLVGGKVELSQREVSLRTLVDSDRWLREVMGLDLGDVVMGDRNEEALEHFRRLGQEWRVRPLAWTDAEMRAALGGSRKRMSTQIRYYHSARGVHFMSFAEFERFAERAETDIAEFRRELDELVGVFEGNACSFVRMPKYRGHHEIEFFGLRLGIATERLVAAVEALRADITGGQLGQLGVIQRSQELVTLYRSLLSSTDLADEESKTFVEMLYVNITGEIYSLMSEGTTPAFDDRRTALPGATFVDGRPVLHPGADDRTEVLLSNLRGMMSKDERIEYANVYELRGEDGDRPLGQGATREVVYKSERRPLENSLVQKRLSHASNGYSAYILARIGALRALGVGLSDFYLILKRRAGASAHPGRDYYIRRRCEGEPMDAIPASYFKSAEDPACEDSEVVLSLASLMGDAAAQNLAMKKYEPKSESPLYGIGKEIYEFEYDLKSERVMPKRVSTCSIRGSFGWPSQAYTDDNLERIFSFYLGHFAHALKIYQRKHSQVSMSALAGRFMDGFEYRTHALSWQLSVMRDRFEGFSPDVPRTFQFVKKWKFVLWSLERQERRLAALRHRFFEKVEAEEMES